VTFHRLIVVACLSTSVVSYPARAPGAQTPVIPDSVWARIWQSVHYPSFDSVAVSAGLTRLRASALPEGHREIRIWVGGGFTAPEDLYRFVDDRGRVSGEVVRYWGDAPLDTAEHPEDLVLRSLRGSCSRFATAARMNTCRADFTRSPDWGAVLKRAEAHDLWTLAQQHIDGTQIYDGWSITVELRDGSRYRAYHYNNPDSRKPSPEAANAVAIRAALGAIDSLARTPDVVKTYRGITTGAYHSEFVDCASRERWEFYNELRSLAESNKVPFQPASDSTARYVVEVVGELTPEWLARRWGSKYTKVLQVFRLASVRPSVDGTCP